MSSRGIKRTRMRSSESDSTEDRKSKRQNSIQGWLTTPNKTNLAAKKQTNGDCKVSTSDSDANNSDSAANNSTDNITDNTNESGACSRQIDARVNCMSLKAATIDAISSDSEDYAEMTAAAKDSSKPDLDDSNSDADASSNTFHNVSTCSEVFAGQRKPNVKNCITSDESDNGDDNNTGDGNASDGNPSDGNASDGNASDGNLSDGNPSDGNDDNYAEAPPRRGVNKKPNTVSSDDDEQNSDHDTLPSSKSSKYVKATSSNQAIDEEDEESYDSDEVSSIDSDDEDVLSDSKLEKQLIVLKYFNESSQREIAIMDGISPAKASKIMSHVPIKDFNQLKSIFRDLRINSDALSQTLSIIRFRKEVSKLVKHCEKISETMHGTLEKIMKIAEETNVQNTSEFLHAQPALINPEYRLKDYQLIGVNWLNQMHMNGINGILADEMGLGKTIQTIAFISHLIEFDLSGPYLVVAPSSTIDNWIREFETWAPDLIVVKYSGSQQHREEIRDQIYSEEGLEFNIMISSYVTCVSTSSDRSFFKKINFEYAIFDEGHMLKNMNTNRYKSLSNVKSIRRLLLTGTPLQNSLIELMSLLMFLMPKFFVSKSDILKTVFVASEKSETQSKYVNSMIKRARNILTPFFFRRLKTDVLTNLGEKTEIDVYLDMGEEQRNLYSKTLDQLKQSKKNSVKVMQKSLMGLRNVSNHPLLERKIYDDDKLKIIAKILVNILPDSNYNYIIEDMEIMSDFEMHMLCKKYKHKLSEYILGIEELGASIKLHKSVEIILENKKKGNKVLLFSQFVLILDIIQEFFDLKNIKYTRLDGSVPTNERLLILDEFNKNEEISVFLISTKAGGLGINLTSANIVILHDIDYNPYNDKQAMDRAHRMGQTKPVIVHRLLCRDSIDENIHESAKYKLQLEKDVTEDKDGDSELNDNKKLFKLLCQSTKT